ncbi:MAG: GNAT family N-acetyltransferase [Pseudomonadota bacterium]
MTRADEVYTVRHSEARDIAQIDALLRRSFSRLLKADYPPSVMVTAVPLISRAQPSLIKSGTYYVAEDEDGAIVGVGGWTRLNPHAGRILPGRASVRHFATDADRARRGVAAALMSRVVEETRALGLIALDCVSTRTAVPFYLAQRFRSVGDVTVTLRPGIVFPAILLQRPIS